MNSIGLLESRYKLFLSEESICGVLLKPLQYKNHQFNSKKAATDRSKEIGYDRLTSRNEVDTEE